MKASKRLALVLCALLCACLTCACGETGGQEEKRMKQLLSDPAFEYGFGVMDIMNTSGYKVVNTLDLLGKAKGDFKWRLAQWGTKPENSFEQIEGAEAPDGAVRYENSGKLVEVYPGSGRIYLEVRAQNEYDAPRESMGMWPHLLIEEVFADNGRSVSLGEISSLNMELDFEIVKSIRHMTDEEYDAGLHCAQVSWYITLNSTKPGVSDYIWFGLPLYDSRSEDRFNDGYTGIDKGTETGTGMLIYSLSSRNYLDSPVGVGNRKAFRIDILPEIQRALDYAQNNGILLNHSIEDFRVGSMNLGWEVPGTYECGLRINKIGIEYEQR